MSRRARRSFASCAFGAATLAVVAACTRSAPAPLSEPPTDPLAPLRTFEAAARARTDFAHAPVSDAAFGADPYALVALPSGGYAGILRGRDALVLLDDALVERARIPTPRAPSAIALVPRGGGAQDDDALVVASELDAIVARYTVSPAPARPRLVRSSDVPFPDRGARGITVTTKDGRASIHVVSDRTHRLVSLTADGHGAWVRHERAVPIGPIRLAKSRTSLYVASVLDHALTAFDLDREGLPGEASATARIDGPFFALAVTETPSGDRVVAGGVEDHALDRRDGYFGYVDSYVYAYLRGATGFERITAIDVGEHGVVVPKAIVAVDCKQTRARPEGTVGRCADDVLVFGYGAPTALRVRFEGARVAATTPVRALPGASDAVATATGVALADPLLDAWVHLPLDDANEDARTVSTVAVPDTDGVDPRVRLGEALFFTDLMAPASTAEGPLSRFTCETCHFEGYVDGRTHHTGRGDVHATTKPLLGLFNNRPHFSRALDPDLASVAENEFRVAGARAPGKHVLDPHFTLDPSAVPWIRALDPALATKSPTELRLALMAFLMRFTHRTNPATVDHPHFTDVERRGAEAFHARCEGCHEARTSADDASSRVSFDAWEARTLREGGPIVWAKDTYEKTGVAPYVHERGARVPSLRRLFKKRPYFTNGTAPALADVVDRARFTADGAFWHDGAPVHAATLDPDTRAALVAFLDLL